MADTFGVDAKAVATASAELTHIRSSLDGLASFAGQGGVTGSARVQRALDDFVKNSSDARTKLEAELERAAGLLSGLAHGATALDRSLGETVPVNAPVPVVLRKVSEVPS
jgi:hypothetical protein